jgi:hypothetical protein
MAARLTSNFRLIPGIINENDGFINGLIVLCSLCFADFADIVIIENRAFPNKFSRVIVFRDSRVTAFLCVFEQSGKLWKLLNMIFCEYAFKDDSKTIRFNLRHCPPCDEEFGVHIE